MSDPLGDLGFTPQSTDQVDMIDVFRSQRLQHDLGFVGESCRFKDDARPPDPDAGVHSIAVIEDGPAKLCPLFRAHAGDLRRARPRPSKNWVKKKRPKKIEAWVPRRVRKAPSRS